MSSKRNNIIDTSACDACGWRIDMCHCPDEQMNAIGGDMQPYSNPMQSHNDHGKLVPFSQAPTFVGPIFLNVASELRDKTIYSGGQGSASFHLEFAPIRGVKSIELVSFETNVITGMTVLNPYLYLANGLGDVATGAFTPQNLMRTFKIPNTSNLGTLGSVVANSFGRIPYKRNFVLDVTKTTPPAAIYEEAVEPWQTGQTRYVHYFKPELGTLSRLEFTVTDNFGNVVEYASDTLGFACTLCVTARVY